jgi:nitrite reductase/ring-hydroxylating ferredoxin subunit
MRPAPLDRQGSPREGSAPAAGRRRVLFFAGGASLLAAATGLLGTLARFLVPEVLYESPRRFAVGPPSDFPPGSATLIPEHRLFVFRVSDGFYAVSAVCTHLGCNVARDEVRGFACPCHGSVFDEAGRVLDGPAPRPLPRYRMTLSQRGELVVDTRRTVGADFRLKA